MIDTNIELTLIDEQISFSEAQKQKRVEVLCTTDERIKAYQTTIANLKKKKTKLINKVKTSAPTSK